MVEAVHKAWVVVEAEAEDTQSVVGADEVEDNPWAEVLEAEGIQWAVVADW